MDVLAMPISGGSFPHQLAILRELMRKDYKPELILGSSGGNVTAYLAMASKWDADGLDRVIRDLDSKFFVESWLPSFANFVPSWVAGLFNGAIYRATDNSYKLFKAYFSPKDITDIEIWVGAVNSETGSLALFCNKSQSQAVIKGEYFQSHLTDSEDLKYLDGDIERICKASIASSSIPVLIQNQVIDGKTYIDGGIKYASPLTPLSAELYGLCNKDGGIHIVYISGYNLNTDVKPKTIKSNIITSGLDATDHVARGLVIHDRLTAFGLIERFGAVNHLLVTDMDAMWKRRKQAKASLVEIYPNSRESIDFTDFRGQDLMTMVDESSKNFTVQVWWAGRDDLFSSDNSLETEGTC